MQYSLDPSPVDFNRRARPKTGPGERPLNRPADTSFGPMAALALSLIASTCRPRPRIGGAMFTYRLHLEDGSDAGEATYSVMIKPGEEIIVGNG